MKQALLTLLILCVLAEPCFAAGAPKKEVRRGNILYNKEEFEEALQQYQAALAEAPDSDIVNFNTGSALYKTGDYNNAIGHFERSLLSEDPSLEQMASYNIGNAKYKYGISKEESDLRGAIGLLKQSLYHYEHSLELDQDDGDAGYNHEFVTGELKRLEEKLEQEKKDQSQEQEKQGAGEKKEGLKGQVQKQEAQEGEIDKQEAQEQKTQGQEEGEAQAKEAREEGSKKEEMAALGQQKEKEEEKDEAGQQAKVSQGTLEELSEKEALMLLEGYRQEEEPKGLYKEKIQTRGLPEVIKDW